jgi:hypothetical protein
MVSYFLFGLLVLTFMVLRGVFRVAVGRNWFSQRMLHRCRLLLADLAQADHGEIHETVFHRLFYVSSNRRVHMEIRCHSRPRLRIRIRSRCPVRAGLYRLPRLVYAFLEAFLSPDMRIPNYFVATSSVSDFARLRAREDFQALLEPLSRAGFSLRFDEEGITLWKRMLPYEMNGPALASILQHAKNLVAIGEYQRIEIPVQPLESSERRCGYCKAVIEEGQSVSFCSLCNTPHHTECFRLNGRCTVFGCSSSRPVESPLQIAG